MAINPIWRACPDFSIHQAALLIAGYDPGDYHDIASSYLNSRAKGYAAVKEVLVTAALSRAIKTTTGLRTRSTDFYDPDEIGPSDVDIELTRIAAEELYRFTGSHDMDCDIFRRNEFKSGGAPGDKFHSAKLVAANRAWAAVTADPRLLKGKSPKQAAADWLTKHAAQLGLLNEDGTVNKSGIQEIAKVVNWKPKGGATPTPTSDVNRSKASTIAEWADLDDEIPF